MEQIKAEQFAVDWITKGWQKVNGVWYEMGASASVVASGVEVPPAIGMHDVAGLLNSRES